MVKSESKKLINGVLRLIQKIVYNDGSSVERVLNNFTRIPETISFFDKWGKKKSF